MAVLALPSFLARRPPKVEFPREPLPAGVLWATGEMRRECEAERLAFRAHPMRGTLPHLPRHRGRYCLNCGQAVVFGATVGAVMAELDVPPDWRAFYERLHEVERWLSVMPEAMGHLAATGDGGNGTTLVLAKR